MDKTHGRGDVMRKVARMYGLLQRQRLTARELAMRVGIAPRTAYHYLQAFADADLGLQREEDGRYWLPIQPPQTYKSLHT